LSNKPSDASSWQCKYVTDGHSDYRILVKDDSGQFCIFNVENPNEISPHLNLIVNSMPTKQHQIESMRVAAMAFHLDVLDIFSI